MLFLNYNDAVEWVHSLPRFAQKPGIENTTEILKKLGNPEKKLKFVHIAGTNGKGSVTMMISAILKSAGYKVGTAISPFVVDFRERFLLNCEMASKEQVATAITQVQRAVGANGSLVEFDAVTSAAIALFASENCDIVCLETGLGGRLDSTNAVQNTLVACITAIGKDHTELLGDTIAQITAEKCGIIKNNCTIVCYPCLEDNAKKVVEEFANKQNCNLIVPCTRDIEMSTEIGKTSESPLMCSNILYKKQKLSVPLAGVHQIYNTSVAYEAAVALKNYGFNISADNIKHGINSVKFPARIEVVREEPLVIIDGSHNAQGARALAQTLKNAQCKNLIGVVGILKNKGEHDMMRALCPFFDKIYTVNPDEKRGLSAQQLAISAEEFCKDINPCNDINHAIKAAYKLAQDKNTGLVVCGSLYLASKARKLFCQG